MVNYTTAHSKDLVRDMNVLRANSRSVDFTQPNMAGGLKNLLSTMRKVMTKYEGIGIAAPQIGSNLRVCIVTFNDGPKTLINPTIVHKTKPYVNVESCLSLHGSYKVLRHKEVIVQFQDEEGEFQRLLVTDPYVAAIVEHEVDHLNGILIDDYKHHAGQMQYIANRKGSLSYEEVLTSRKNARKLSIDTSSKHTSCDCDSCMVSAKLVERFIANLSAVEL